MTHLPFAFPHTIDWLVRRLDLRARHELRSVLRRLERASDARLVALWAVESNVKTQVVEISGDDDAMPSALPMLTSSVPSRETMRDRRGEHHDAAVHKIRVGGDAPTLGVAIVVPGVQDGPALFDALESAAEQIETIVVEAAERSDRARRAAARDEAAQRRARAREYGQ